MSRWVLIMILAVVLSVVAPAQEQAGRFIAELPNGGSVELIGLRNYSVLELNGIESKDWRWWRADGSLLAERPDEGTGQTSWAYARYFVIHVAGCPDCSCIATGPLGKDVNPRPVTERGPAFDETDDLRWFTLRFNAEQKAATIRIGLAVGDWTVVESWPFWKNAKPHNAFFSSEDEVILRCPEQRRKDVVAEVTHAFGNEATRLRILDKEGEWRESRRGTGGEGGGLVRYIHTFENLGLDDIERIEFQKRSYDYWIVLKNVSLLAEQRTVPEIEVEERQEGLIGKALPKLGQASVDSAIEKHKGERIFLCFWDVGQRPSRNCIQLLAERGELLAENRIHLVLVHVGPEQTLSPVQWLERSNLRLATEAYEGGEVKARLLCGVKSLPWLILTDEKHVVVAEGFGVSELDEKMKSVGGD